MKNNNLSSTKEWLIVAQEDLETAEIIYREKGPSSSLCFHCHQSIEKYLKAYLVSKDIHFPKIHSLWQLAKLCAIKNKKFLSLEEKLKTLDAYYIESRYPPEVFDYSRQECKEILEETQELVKFIINEIKI